MSATNTDQSSAGNATLSRAETSRTMSDAYVVQIEGITAGIIVREHISQSYSFFASARRFDALERRTFSGPQAAEHAARSLIPNRSSNRKRAGSAVL